MENLYLHRYVRADVEEPHCHPWANATCVLSGWYTEDVYEAGIHVGSFRRNPGDVVIRRAGEIHAITGCAQGTISLFATMRKEREWGFHTAEGFIPWADFRAWKNARMEADSVSAKLKAYGDTCTAFSTRDAAKAVGLDESRPNMSRVARELTVLGFVEEMRRRPYQSTVERVWLHRSEIEKLPFAKRSFA
jgi:hypothetical protein